MTGSACASILVAIYKNKGDRELRTNYRGITLVKFLWRVVMTLLLKPVIIPVIERELPDAGAGLVAAVWTSCLW